MSTSISHFWAEESGAIETDWIVLTGAIMGISLSAVVAVRGGVSDLGLDIQGSLSAANIASLLGEEETPYGFFYFQNVDNPRSAFSRIMTSYASLSDEQLLTTYNNAVASFQNYLSQGDATNAGAQIDLVYGMNQLMSDRDMELPNGGQDVSTLSAGYYAAFG